MLQDESKTKHQISPGKRNKTENSHRSDIDNIPTLTFLIYGDTSVFESAAGSITLGDTLKNREDGKVLPEGGLFFTS